MANDLVASLLPEIVAGFDARGFGRNESRRSRYGVLEFHQEQTRQGNGLVTPEIQRLVDQSLDRDVKIPVLDTKDITITNVRTCTIPDSANKSNTVTITFVTYHYGFTITPREFNNNSITYAQIMRHEIETFVQKLAATLDTAARNNLENNKNTYNPAAITAYYPVVGNALQVTQAQKNDLFNNANAILETMDFYGTTHVLGSTTLRPIINRLAAQGGGNATNEDFQFNGYEWHFSNRITNGAGIQATAYLVQDGNVAIVQRLDPDCLARRRSGAKEWDTIDNFPLINMPVDTYYYSDCRDLSSVRPSMSRAFSEAYSFAVDVAFLNSYNSDPATRYSPIQKVEVSTT